MIEIFINIKISVDANDGLKNNICGLRHSSKELVGWVTYRNTVVWLL